MLNKAHTAIDQSLKSIFSNCVINPESHMTDEQMRMVLIALDMLRSVIDKPTAYQIKYGYKPVFDVNISNGEKAE